MEEDDATTQRSVVSLFVSTPSSKKATNAGIIVFVPNTASQ